MRGRNDILADIRANKPKFSAPAPDVPDYDDSYPSDVSGLQARFIGALEKMGGVWADPETGETLEATMRRALTDKLDANGIIASNVPEISGNRRVRAEDTPSSLHDIDVAVLRARFGIAETGSVCFTEAELAVNAVAYLAQHLVVLLDPGAIETNLHRAYRRDDYINARYTVFHTGPSATADIEGVLVHGAQGVRSLTIIPAR
ncbi:LutC/YkgG family protein [Salinisphaera sp.]|uniref:LutC/YkgG family protein n=1 Tax=Salinisphaera sp. TaxID=1914330 RepID=UPI002D785DFE|nr:LUD domain-containing protein [Salinisphaera sp.]HET7315319.1 LUD domain-containing protein [Salinisphaera sp.]